MISKVGATWLLWACSDRGGGCVEEGGATIGGHATALRKGLCGDIQNIGVQVLQDESVGLGQLLAVHYMAIHLRHYEMD